MGPPPGQYLERKVIRLIFFLPEVNWFFQALDVIGTYMTSSAVAPLNKEFVETDSPLW